MQRQYDLFEKLPDGSLDFRSTIAGLECAIAALKNLSTHTDNDCVLIYLPTRTVIAMMHGTESSSGDSAQPASPDRTMSLVRREHSLDVRLDALKVMAAEGRRKIRHLEAEFKRVKRQTHGPKASRQSSKKSHRGTRRK